MAGRRALISKDDLDRMAATVAAHGIVFKGRVDPLGVFSFTVEPSRAGSLSSDNDLGSEFDDWAAS